MGVLVADSLAIGGLDLAKELFNTGYTIKWILEMLHKNNPKFVKALGNSKVKEIVARDISEGKGFLSRVHKVQVEFDDDTAKSAFAFIMKVPTMDCLEKAFDVMGMDEASIEKMKSDLVVAHNFECDAYELLKGIADFPRVETYCLERIGGERPGVIVMDDLSECATTTGLVRSVTGEQCLNLARHFASFQVQINSMDGWRGKYRDSFHTSSLTVTQTPTFIEKLITLKPEFKEATDRLLSVDIMRFNWYCLKELPEKYNAMTLCQGDCWANNVLIRTAEDGSVMDKIAAVVDWQIIFEGNPLFDLGRFITLCADAEVRREFEVKMVDTYYDSLVEGYAKSNQKPAFTREQAHEMYEHAFMQQTYGLLFMICYAFVMDEEKGERVQKAQGEKFTLRARLGLEDAFERMEKYGMFERFKKAD